MSISIINSQVKDFVYVPPREKCVRPTLCPFRVRTHQVLLRTHVCVILCVKLPVKLPDNFQTESQIGDILFHLYDYLSG